MGERTFEVGEGPWGDDPTFHAPCFVLSHDAREPIGKQGGTTYTFVTDGIERALEQARAAADGRISRSASSSDELEGEDLSHTAATRESGFVRTEE
jgi:dihydrofolate reductase